jgi:biotin-(acetyl-CoA carboxylase) ligase
MARAAASQFETLAALARRGVRLPDGLACVAAGGAGFRGFHGRSWVAAPGNIQLTVHLAPERAVPGFETAFLALAALAAVDAIDRVPGLAGRAGIRWVNDLVIDDAKVGGVLARTQSQGDVVAGVLLGVGLNVETLPRVAPTAFVPRAAALRDFAPEPAAVRVAAVLADLLAALRARYDALAAAGCAPLAEAYRARSTVLGRAVRVSEDTPDEVPRVFAAGRVRAIGDGLELLLDGDDRPVRRGRLVALAAPAARRAGGGGGVRGGPSPEMDRARPWP